MQARKSKSIAVSSANNGIKLYVEGKTEREYLQALMRNEVIKFCTIDPQLQGNSVERIIEQIFHQDLNNDAIDLVIWIVDGGDEHICGAQAAKKRKKKLSIFQIFYQQWLNAESSENWAKLHILVNQPAIEFWTLLHFENCSVFFANCDALLSSQELQDAIPGFTKGQSGQKLRALTSLNSVERNLAIRHAAGLDEANRNKGLEEKTALGLAQAQIYQIFDLLKY